MNKELKALGDNIRAWRKKAKFTIGELAELSGLDSGFLNFIELGSKAPSFATLSKIAKALNISLADLFRGIPKSSEDADYALAQQIRALLHGRTATQKAELIPLLKSLRDPQTEKAVRHLLRR